MQPSTRTPAATRIILASAATLSLSSCAARASARILAVRARQRVASCADDRVRCTCHGAEIELRTLIGKAKTRNLQSPRLRTVCTAESDRKCHACCRGLGHRANVVTTSGSAVQYARQHGARLTCASLARLQQLCRFALQLVRPRCQHPPAAHVQRWCELLQRRRRQSLHVLRTAQLQLGAQQIFLNHVAARALLRCIKKPWQCNMLVN